MLRVVVGCFFDLAGEHLVLIRKRRPAWQEGLLNGPGGKVEGSETPLAAMTREFFEETGAYVESWEPVLIRRDAASEVFFFTARGDVHACSTKTDEQVEIVQVSALQDLEVMYNLRWIVPLALSSEPIVRPVIVTVQ